jgi:hypothetical protein
MTGRPRREREKKKKSDDEERDKKEHTETSHQPNLFLLLLLSLFVDQQAYLEGGPMLGHVLRQQSHVALVGSSLVREEVEAVPDALGVQVSNRLEDALPKEI